MTGAVSHKNFSQSIAKCRVCLISGVMAPAAFLLLDGCAQAPQQSLDKPPAVQNAAVPARTWIAKTEAAQFPVPVVEIGESLSSSALISRAVARQRQKVRAQSWVAADDDVDLSSIGRMKSGASRKKVLSQVTSRNPSKVQSGKKVQVSQPEVSAACESAAQKTSPLKQGKTRPQKNEEACSASAMNLVGVADSRMTRGSLIRRVDPWETVRNGLVLASVQHERLDAHLENLRQRPGTVDFLMTRAEPYLQYLLDEIRRQRLPTDIILVPMVESAFQTTALSNKQAAGLWQFIPTTGQQYGLLLNDRYDGRYDTHSATQAALKYLKRLNALFSGDWLLTFAAYNAGEGAVQRAVQFNRIAGGGGTFWELSLPQETQNYVVKILALSKVVADPAARGFKPHRAMPRNTLARVEARPEIRIADLIASSGIAPDDFYKLNPAFKPDVEPPEQPHNFLLPLEKAEILMAANMPGAKVYAPRKVVVQKGDTLSVLAKRHGVPEVKLSEWNGLPPKAPLKVGQEILVLGV